MAESTPSDVSGERVTNEVVEDTFEITKKETRYYWRHRAEILAKRHEKKMEDEGYRKKMEERERLKAERAAKKEAEVAAREEKRRLREAAAKLRNSPV
jgi:hypothetical protein